MKAVDKKLLRILDANFNRSREGLRVCEDILRFLTRRRGLAGSFRMLRHEVTGLLKGFPLKDVLGARDVGGDLLKDGHRFENHRRDWADIYWANLERSKESLRVLEEILKLISVSKSAKAKTIRFDLYELEKKSLGTFKALRHR